MATGGQPFQSSLEIKLPAGTAGANGAVTVPTGKRLVIEYVSGRGNVPDGQRCWFSVITRLSTASTGTEHFLPTDQTPAAGTKDQSTAGQVVKLYADAGNTVTLRAVRDGSTGDGVARMAVSGYLLDPAVGVG